jgi:DNA-binding transcriptional LysR family regulator
VTATIDLNAVAAFVRVMESGSFTAAARALGLPKSSVSRRVSALEQELGVRLLQRSTRKLVLTEAGRGYFERTRAALAGLTEASVAASDMRQEVAGPIRFSAAADGTGLLTRLLAEFLARYPKVQLQVMLTPRRVDLVNEGVDLALRAGALADSSLVARRLGGSDLGLFATRAYLRRAGKPTRPDDLARHRFVLYGPPHERETLRLDGPDGVKSVKVSGPLLVDEMTFVRDAVVAGVGIGLTPVVFYAALPGARRRPFPDVVRVLPEYGVRGVDLHLVSPPTAYEPIRVTLFRDFLTERYRPLLKACAAAPPTLKR